MIGYRPSSPWAAAEVAAVLAATVAAGLALTRRRMRGMRSLAWLSVVVAVLGAERLTAAEPGGFRMLAICGALLFGFKAVVGTAELAAGGAPLPARRWLGFVMTWPGMDVRPFARRRDTDGADGSRPVLVFLGAGGASVLLARLLWLWTGNAWLATPPLLFGLSLMVHFGLFGIASALWRRAGFACPDAFSAPQNATSLSDFWGRRWNGPFSDLMRNTVYRPIAGLGFPAGALYAAFLFSGALHELAISVPARAGYGRPLAYFALQGLFVLAERSHAPGFPTRFWAWIAILAPLPLLLVPEFLRTAIWPLAGIR